ncbi:MAG: DUF4270 family protein [Bacteroidota bacterium]|nr:DUF4270 family protein [Bacteroidota bacterium]
MKKFKTIVFVIISSLILVSCKKDHSILGTDVQPEIDALSTSFTDTSTIYAYTKKYDIAIGSFNDSYKYIGSNQDPIFGRTDVGLYCNANTNLSNVSFGLDANLVSAELIFAIPINSDFVGDSAIHLTYSVYPITTTLSTTTVYYSTNDSLHNKNTPIGGGTVGYSLYNGTYVLRIPIDYNYANAILMNPQYLTDNTTFNNIHKGFFITSKSSGLNPISSQGIIAKFNLDDANSGFFIHYTNGSPSAVKDYKSFQFYFSGSNAVRFNTCNYQPNQSGNINLQNQYYNVLPDSVQEYLFLKGMGGSRLKLNIPNLNYLKKYSDTVHLAINRAEIVLNIDPTYSFSNQYYPPATLALLPLDSLGRENYAIDQLSSTDFARYGGSFDSDKQRYVFNIARHVQSIVNGETKNYGFYLVVADGNRIYTARRDNFINRLVLAGSNNASLKPKLNLSFIKFRNEK